ncbi:hypothetical protein TWF481_011064 [Arthrobotrys musiformis]|uniref:Asteroid domain-containing protein n=1 Tax=Arthrobotrys musiformis TaxID=47236 RepID=A0AAV9VX73_9PEZI
MGIPQLLAHLSRIEKPKQAVFPADSTRPAAVIDGSALAHFLFNRYIKKFSKEERVNSVLGFDYGNYMRSVVSWLEKLEEGFEIVNIFIDGHLPYYKTTTRTSRIQSTIKSLSWLRSVSPSVVDLTKGGWNPTPPFLIAAFITAVKTHERFGKFSRVVPGEADAFCAAVAVGVDGVVFTADSDLLVYPHSKGSRVVMLEDVDFEGGVKVSLWSPYSISQKLGGGEGGILKLAWCLSIRDTLRAARILNGGKVGDVNISKEFGEEYLLPKNTSDGVEVIDSRAAEVIYSSPSYKHLCHPAVRNDGEIEIYLPVLLEDVTTSTVWTIGRQIRKQAYKTLFPSTKTLTEIHRKGEGVNKSLLTLDDEIPPRLEIEGLNANLLCVILQIAREYSDKRMELSTTDVLSLLAAITPSPGGIIPVKTTDWTWPRAHLFSQLTAGVWSLHLLHTVSNLRSGGGEEVGLFTVDAERFIAIHSISLPGKSRNARKRARKRVKTDEGGVEGVINRMFEREVRGSVAEVLKLVGAMKAGEDDEEDGDDDAGDSYMGMTVG